MGNRFLIILINSSPCIVQVRQVAGQTIGGLMKTDLFRDSGEILEQLKAMARTKLPKGTKSSQTGQIICYLM